MYPKLFKKVLKLISDLGVAYEEIHAFDKDIVKKLGKPYELTKFQLGLFELANKVGLNNVWWHKMLRQNNALDKRLDRPFL